VAAAAAALHGAVSGPPSGHGLLPSPQSFTAQQQQQQQQLAPWQQQQQQQQQQQPPPLLGQAPFVAAAAAAGAPGGQRVELIQEDDGPPQGLTRLEQLGHVLLRLSIPAAIQGGGALVSLGDFTKPT